MCSSLDSRPTPSPTYRRDRAEAAFAPHGEQSAHRSWAALVTAAEPSESVCWRQAPAGTALGPANASQTSAVLSWTGLLGRGPSVGRTAMAR